ncbi:MAG: hypothetical protein JW874_08455 [Spirochaetales bacterium]|nr:hypothetical protein [Spirochaetales bacterium]
MEKILNQIAVNYSDAEINNAIKTVQGKNRPFSRHFNQNEEFFLQLDSEITVPGLPVHHDIRKSRPSAPYLSAIRQVISQLAGIIPSVLSGLVYFFDPGEILRPCFFQLYRYSDKQYLYLLRIDLSFRTHEAELIDRGDNNTTPAYKTRNLFLEADFIPLSTVNTANNKITDFLVNQTVSQTWIGETGRGYFVQGIWIDQELSKYFSRLFFPDDVRSYPYYPFPCKYRTVCHSVLNLDQEGRKKHLPLLIRAMNFLVPRMRDIEKSLRSQNFSPEMPFFLGQKQLVPTGWNDIWRDLKVNSYLNSKDMKEYSVDF